MDIGELLTRGTVWLALALHVGGEMVKVTRRGRKWWATARWLNSFGCASFAGHVACAFHFSHAWSHSAAYSDTARQTAELFGWNWGGGLYVNYVFTVLWLGEVAWFWANPRRYLQRPKWMTWAVRGFFLFMMLNGAVVFARGTVRWLGLMLCLTMVGCWWRGRNQLAGLPDQSKST